MTTPVRVTPQYNSGVDPTQVGGYKCHDLDESSSTLNYFGFVNDVGKWYILEYVSATTSTFRISQNATNYTSGWAARASLTYDYIYNSF